MQLLDSVWQSWHCESSSANAGFKRFDELGSPVMADVAEYIEDVGDE